MAFKTSPLAAFVITVAFGAAGTGLANSTEPVNCYIEAQTAYSLSKEQTVTLCKNAVVTRQIMICYTQAVSQLLVSGSDAVRLCAGTSIADKRLRCFQEALDHALLPTALAIDLCTVGR